MKKARLVPPFFTRYPYVLNYTRRAGSGLGLPSAPQTASDQDNMSTMRKHDHIDKLKTAEPVAGDLPIPHGIFVNQCLRDRDHDLFGRILEQLHKDSVFNASSDILQVELVALYSVRLIQAQDAGNTEAAEIWDRMIRAHLKDLRASKKAREGAASASRAHL